MEKQSRRSLVIGFALTALAGCASTPDKPTVADFMRKDASQAQAQVDLKNQIAQEWEKGNKLVMSGEKKVKSGEEKVKSGEDKAKSGQKQIDEGRSLLEGGNKEIDEGRKMMQESELKFRTSFPEAPIKAQ
jgi:hypothetical protein